MIVEMIGASHEALRPKQSLEERLALTRQVPAQKTKIPPPTSIEGGR
jgi:hypothetical protein